MVKMTAARRSLIPVTLCLSVVAMLFFVGCGASGTDSVTGCSNDDLAPFGATMTLNPVTSNTTVAVGTDYTVSVLDSTGKRPLSGVCVSITGGFAAPSTGLYTFQLYPTATSPNIAVNSGFTVRTNNVGLYVFSALPAVGSGTWTDGTIKAVSGIVSSPTVTLSCTGC
jgi:hypothetical protein